MLSQTKSRKAGTKSILALSALLCFVFTGKSQTVEFFDDFEAGAANWTLTGDWFTTTTQAYSGSASLTESPAGNYPDQTTWMATMTSGVDLSSALDANLSFWAIYDIELNFDYLYVDVSDDGATTWVNIAEFTGEGNLTTWVNYNFSLGGFVGSTDVRVRFRMVTDAAVNGDGMYIDDFEITSSMTDNAVPLISHIPPFLYEGSLGDHPVQMDLIDISGIDSTSLTYTVDGASPQTIGGISTGGNGYLFTIPQQNPGAQVDYWFMATDASANSNTVMSDTFSYIAGNYIRYEAGLVDFVNSFGPIAQSGLAGTAVRFTLNGTTDLTTALIRNYIDPMRSNDTMDVHIWADAGGIPGADLITPIRVFPEATLDEPNAMTRIDLRPYAAQLSNLSGDIFVGFTVAANEVWTQQTTPGVAGRTFVYDGVNWGTITDDYHFRIITDSMAGAPAADFSFDASGDPGVDFTDLSTNAPNAWSWDFGDGGSSTLQNPTHNYSANGAYSVCLTASNLVGSSTHCETVTISGNPAPVANFTYDDVGSPQIAFTDASTNNPDSWLWDFGDGVLNNIDQNPVHIYTAAGTYSVCLTAANANGSDQFCDQIVVEIVDGIEEFATGPDIEIFPVPSSGMVEITSEQRIQSIVILDIRGAEVTSFENVNSKTFKTDLSALSSGHYFFKAVFEDGVAAQKWILGK